MERSAFTVFVDGIILDILGIAMLAIPETFLNLLNLSLGDTVLMTRIIGLLLILIGIYYVFVAFNNLREFFIISVIGRLLFFFGTVLFFLFDFVGPQIFIISILDLITSLWTLWAIHSNRPRHER